MRQPSRWRPSGAAVSRSAGVFSKPAVSMVRGRPCTLSPMNFQSKARAPFRRINASEVFGDARIASDCHAIPTLLPKQKLQQSLGVALVERNVGAFVRQYRGAINGDGTIAAFERNREILARPLSRTLAW